MIKDGKFQNSAIRDIAFHARLAESTTLHFFPSRATLLDELELYVIEEVNAAIAESLGKSRDLKTQFINTWKVLNKFYCRNPGIFKFIDQSTIILGDNARAAKFFDAINKQFTQLLNEIPGNFTPEQGASIFQISVISAVKLTTEQFVHLSAEHLNVLALSAWNTISKKVAKPLAKLPRAVEPQGQD